MALPCWAATAAAQPAEEETGTAADLQSVVVTGTRIAGTAPVGSDIVSIGAEQMQLMPSATPVEILNREPIFSGVGSNPAMKRTAGPGASSTTNGTRGAEINLRGIGPRATLVLFDGSRRPIAGQSARTLDQSNIPVLALDRVEIVADGASAIYGSDAVAGVVNFIPRKTFDGLRVQLRHGAASSYDSDYLGVLAGREYERGGFVFAAEHNRQSNLAGSDRSWWRSDLTDRGGNDYRSLNCAPGTIIAGGTTYAIPAGGVTPATAGLLVPGTANRCDHNQRADITPEQEITNLYGAFKFDLTERVTLNAKVLTSKREWTLQEVDFGSQNDHQVVTVPSTNAYFVRPPGTTGAVQVGYFFGSDRPGNSLIVEGHPAKWFNAGAGLDFELAGGWRGSLSYDYSKNDDGALTFGILTSERTRLLASSDPAVAYNVFGAGGGNTGLKASQLFTNYFFTWIHSRLKNAQASLTGPLFELPGGPVQMAIGGEWYKVDVETGNLIGDFLTRDTRPPALVITSRTVRAGYAEMFVPLVGSENRMSGVRSLDLSLAVRYDKYSDVGGTTNPRFGINWAPTEGLKLRTAYATSFIAPDVSQTVSPSISSQITYASRFDPLVGANTIGAIWLDGNPTLSPEEAETLSIGLDFAPVAVPGLELKATYYRIDYDGQIGSLNNTTALQDPFFATYITRNPAGALLDTLEQTVARVTGTRPPATAWLMDTRAQNLGGSRIRGIDASARYQWDRGNSEWYAGAMAAYVLSYDAAATTLAPFVDNLNNLYFPLRLRARANLGWNNGPWYAEGFVNFVGSHTNNLVTPNEQIGSHTSLDLRGGIRLGELLSDSRMFKRATLGVEVLNVTDEPPPYANIDTGVDVTVASPVGRHISVTLTAEF
jgi:iron complex outermembrane receptor protein